MRRRDFIKGIVGSGTVWPLAALAQQGERMRRIGVLMNAPADDPEGQARIAAFHQGLQEWGWTLGQNARIDVRWGAVDADSSRRYAAELVGLAPDVILASASAAVEALQQTTRSVPIVFTSVTDPVGAGFVETLAHPGGNITGFSLFEYTLSAPAALLGAEWKPISRRAVWRAAAALPVRSCLRRAVPQPIKQGGWLDLKRASHLIAIGRQGSNGFTSTLATSLAHSRRLVPSWAPQRHRPRCGRAVSDTM
jgi:hypothetical protein